jgi:flagellar basal body P-ring protein FlgI
MTRSVALAAAVLFAFAPAAEATRIKDVVTIQGVRSNQLVGYGLVIGLNGSGDSLRNSPFTEQSLQSMLDRMGVNVRTIKPRTRNVAAVIVTAELPAFVGRGSRIDITVSSLGDATSLLGGSLVLTPLQGPDNRIYAVAQGPLAVSGFSAQGQGAGVTQNVPTAARIPNGALVEREPPSVFSEEHTITYSTSPNSTRMAADLPRPGEGSGDKGAGGGYLPSPGGAGGGINPPDPDGTAPVPDFGRRGGAAGVYGEGRIALELRNPDFSTAVRVADAINTFTRTRYGMEMARERDLRTVILRKPANINAARFLAEVTELPVEPDAPARVVVDERTGTIVIGANVQISTVAVAHGNLTVKVTEGGTVSQPEPFSEGQTVVIPDTVITADQEGGSVNVVQGSNLQTLVGGLNRMGLKPNSIIAILQAIKSAGALQADLVVQ